MKMVQKGITAAILSETFYGLSYVFTKSATGYASPFYLLFWRFLIAFLAFLLLIVFRIVKIDLKGKPLRPLFIIALFNPIIYFSAETGGIANLSATESGIFLASIPIFSLIASAIMLKKRAAKLQLLGILITLSGVILTTMQSDFSASYNAIGYAMLLVAVLSYALYSVSIEKANSYSDLEITFFMLLSGFVFFSIVGISKAAVEKSLFTLLSLPFTNISFMIASFYQGICCSILAFFLSSNAISTIGVNKTSSFIGLATVVSIVAGILFLSEPFSVYQAIGSLMILSGVYIANSTIG